jgi:hypothetical protein
MDGRLHKEKEEVRYGRYLMGEENQSWRFGVCLLITYVPLSPSRIVSTPSCRENEDEEVD